MATANDIFASAEANKRIAEAERAIARAWEMHSLIEDKVAASEIEAKIINLGAHPQ